MTRKPDYEAVLNGRMVRAYRRRSFIEVLVFEDEKEK